MNDKPCILCVDDERVVLNALKDQLRTKLGNDFVIEVAESGEEAIQLFEDLIEGQFEVPIIISDYIMPGMKGDELLHHIHRTHPETIKILLTGQATLEGVTNIINKANLYRFIAKPWDVEDLTLAIIEGAKSYRKDKTIEDQNQKLKRQNQELLDWTDAFVKSMSMALDARDRTTAGHSKRIAEFALLMAEAINNVNYGKYKDTHFSDVEIKELYYSALLHDIGKIGVKESILYKNHRISTDRISMLEYRMRWFFHQTPTETKPDLQQTMERIRSINEKEYLTDDDIEWLDHLSQISFTDMDGTQKSLLDPKDCENLRVRHGDLTEDERDLMKTHASLSYSILKGIPWPTDLINVPEYASYHHEKLDGSGYQKQLSQEEIPLQTRILTILDIFEALTAPDRPYRKRKNIDEALSILKKEVESGQLDPDLFEVFLTEQIYAKEP